MRIFSKSKLLALRQCSKRLWLEVHRPELRSDSSSTEARFRAGHEVGEIAQQIYDPDQRGALIDINVEGFKQALERTRQLMNTPQPIFEAGFSAGGAIAFADVMLPNGDTKPHGWKMVEVKSSTSVKDYHRDDVAIQHYVAQTAGVPLSSIAVACIDSSWTYPGGADYRGLLAEHDLTGEAQTREEEVKAWISQAQQVTAQAEAPDVAIGSHCDAPFPCGFYSHCSEAEVQPEFPVHWLPRISGKVVEKLASEGVDDLRHVPDELLNERQQRVKHHTLTGTVYFDADGARSDLSGFPLPAQFLDFETIQFAVPIWAGTRPYQQIPFQFSLHTLLESGELEHTEFLSLTGQDPSLGLAQALIAACSTNPWPIFAYNAGFEKSRIRDLAERFPECANALLAINERIQDLLPIARERYYHPSQQGSWSIKAVLPAVVPKLRYDDLEGVQDGGMAMDAFLEALHPQTSSERKQLIQEQLLAYCKLDTYAMVKLWQVFAGRMDLEV